MKQSLDQKLFEKRASMRKPLAVFAIPVALMLATACGPAADVETTPLASTEAAATESPTPDADEAVGKTVVSSCDGYISAQSIPGFGGTFAGPGTMLEPTDEFPDGRQVNQTQIVYVL
ncbi:MAG: hypothetical protein V3S68_08860, partial [Dehalococcoidia bacterium]